MRTYITHGKFGICPIQRCSYCSKLLEYFVTFFIFPFPNFLDKLITTEVLPIFTKYFTLVWEMQNYTLNFPRINSINSVTLILFYYTAMWKWLKFTLSRAFLSKKKNLKNKKKKNAKLRKFSSIFRKNSVKSTYFFY